MKGIDIKNVFLYFQLFYSNIKSSRFLKLVEKNILKMLGEKFLNNDLILEGFINDYTWARKWNKLSWYYRGDYCMKLSNNSSAGTDPGLL